MKKTKCDGESPCKRCKDDGLVCTAGSRKKTEFKQLPRGYAEVLENTQYALIATVQKLYTMVRNNESWELGEPELNDRGQPVIHDIASKLGCIRPSPDLPFAFPEGESDFAELQAQLQQARSEMGSEDVGSGTHSVSTGSPQPDRHDRASSIESDHSTYNRMFTSPARSKVASKPRVAPVNTAVSNPALSNLSRNSSSFDEEPYSSRASFESASSMPSPVYTDFQTESPMFSNVGPFATWSATDDFLGQPHPLDLTAHYIKQSHTQYNGIGMPRHSPLATSIVQGPIVMNDGLILANGTIQPGMLDCSTGYEISDSMDTIIYGAEYDAQMTMV